MQPTLLCAGEVLQHTAQFPLIRVPQLTDAYYLEKQDFDLHIMHHLHRITADRESEINLIYVFFPHIKSDPNKNESLESNYAYNLFKNVHQIQMADINLTEEEWLNICKTQVITSSSGEWRRFVWKNILRFFITSKIQQLQNGTPQWGRC